MKYIAPVGATDPDESYVTGNPATGTPGSRVGGPAIEHPMREIVHFIEAAGLVPDESNLGQLVEAFNKMGSKQEVGKLSLRIVDPSNLPALAPNELVPMGQLLNRADYPELWEYIQASGAMVSDSAWQQSGREAFFSSGNGSTTFRPGNLVTGVFPRFLDLTGLYDPDRASRVGGNVAGSWQRDAIRNISGTYTSTVNEGLANFNTPGSTNGLLTYSNFKTENLGRPQGSNTAAFSLEFDASRVVPTGSDNRSFNIAVLPTYIYK
ncbi:hypothetical protein [Endozoicomonas acroporae]|uniref:hypothetical protein n=1 Tax=Endozoicomonas acroporae TaxID=1701104 RepID=UPI0013D30357|nr:hypothetical protein [Endozoicomonas acroporae]